MTRDELRRRIDRLPSELKEDFEERAAIMEYLGNMHRLLAESLAWERISRRIKR